MLASINLLGVGAVDFIQQLLTVPEKLQQIIDLITLGLSLLKVVGVLLALQVLSLTIFIFTWFNTNTINYEGKFDIRLLSGKARRKDQLKKRELDIQLTLTTLGLLDDEGNVIGQVVPIEVLDEVKAPKKSKAKNIE